MLKQTMTWLAMAVFSVITAQAQQGRGPTMHPPSSFLMPNENGKTPIVITTKSRKRFSRTIFRALFPMERRTERPKK
jgi:hypothetical protein